VRIQFGRDAFELGVDALLARVLGTAPEFEQGPERNRKCSALLFRQYEGDAFMGHGRMLSNLSADADQSASERAGFPEIQAKFRSMESDSCGFHGWGVRENGARACTG
jgi:hypothetical protein